MKHLLLLIASSIACIPAFAQQPLHCGTDEMHHQLFQQHPEYNAGIQLAYERLQAHTNEYLQAAHPKSGAAYIIPVVFHVIHNYGNENISDAQIFDAIEQVNLQFRKLNPDTSDIVAPFQSIAADAQIEIRLAQIDPDGNCTNGITRTPSLLSYAGDHAVKSLIQWPPDKYLNIYVCLGAAGLAGHALMPTVADTIPEWDGIVMQHSYVGTIGTSDYYRRTVLTHEIGHYLNLQHIWGGNNVPGFPYLPVGDPGNCAYDDDVLDTPNTIGWSYCNINEYTCGELENVQNYMDYAYCARMFTEGQKQRMHAALNSPVANRNNLWQPANLVATGTDDLNYSLCQALFSAEKRIVCAGDPVDFTDISYHGVTDRLWSFEGGTASSLTSAVTTVTYAAEGTYDVTLVASNGTDTVELTIPDYITVIPATGTMPGLTEDFESEPSFHSKWFLEEGAALNDWEFAQGGFASDRSFTIANFYAEDNATFGFYSKPIDAGGLSTFAISFDWAYSQRTSNDADIFRISISNNCGDSWSIKKNYSGLSTLPSVADTLMDLPFTPADLTEWNSDTVFINGAANLTDHLMVKFSFESSGGNNFYLDNIRMGHPSVLGLGDEALIQLHVFPNPSTDQAAVTWQESAEIDEILLIDASGQLVKRLPVEQLQSQASLDLANVAAGYYTIVAKSKSGQVRMPHVIVR
ncbi:MAG TPA: M43 family zinc metalloprotease [Fluviicola sp.]|nr:M43 family zinc metalloprotease [Fluviicola sp.]